MHPEKVSIITPCYNTGKYLPNLLDSVLEQSYPYIEMIAVDDGSTDNTAEIIKKYVKQFEEKGFTLTYVWQENSGQSVAIQRGLNMMNGEYLVWPDSDDYYASSDAIAKMVERLKTSPDDVAMVRTQVIMVEDSEDHKFIGMLGLDAKELENKDLFEDCVFVKNSFYFCSGAYMVKVKALLKSSKLPFYTSQDAGQNWQLMLPVLYHYRCSTILEPLYHIVCRINSHSRSQKMYPQHKARIETYRDTILNTLRNIINILPEDLEYYIQQIKIKYTTELFNIAINHKQKDEVRQYYSLLSEKQDETNMFLIKFKYWLFNNHIYWIWLYWSIFIGKLKSICK